MDPIAHTLTGAALAAAGLRRATPLATAALILGANAPDIDVVMMLAGDYMAVAHRRGWTHGLPALVILPFLVTAVLLLWDRHMRRRWRPHAEPVRPGALLAVAALGVISHPVLDWLNNYGMRWLMPFDGRWFYGDALFIIDPWVWLTLGGAVFLTWSRRPAALAAWALFWLLTSWLALTSPRVPDPARVLWVAGIVVVLVARLLQPRSPERHMIAERTALATVLVVGTYMTVNALANVPARAEVRAELAAHGIGPVSAVMVGPMPANPFQGLVVAETPDAYHVGTWHWLADPRFQPTGRPIPRNMDGPVIAAAADTLYARRFLSWARFPYAEVENRADGYTVRFDDARYPRGTGPGGGPTVRLDQTLRPVPMAY